MKNMYSKEYAMNVLTIPSKFNSWHRININCRFDDVKNVNMLLRYLKDKYKILPNIISNGNLIIYNKNNQNNLNLNKTFTMIYKDMNKNTSEYLILDIDMLNESDGCPVFCPLIIYSL